MKNRDALCMSDRLSLIGKIRDDGIFSMRMLTASLNKKNLPKAPILRPTQKKSEVLQTKPAITQAVQVRQEEQRRRQFAILSERRAKMEKEKKEKLKRDAEALKSKANQNKTKKSYSPNKKERWTKLTPEEIKKLERLVAFIEARNPLATSSRPANLLLTKLRNRFKEITSKYFMLSQCVSGMSPDKQLFYNNGIPALTTKGCIICEKSNVKVIIR